LHRELVKSRKVAMVAMAAAFQLEQAGLLAAGGALSPFGDTSKAIEALGSEIEKIRSEDVSDAELTKAKNTPLQPSVTAQVGVESKASLLGNAACLRGDTDEVNREVARYRAVTAGDVRRVAQTYLTPERRTTVVVKPTLMGMLRSVLGGGGKGASEDEGAAEPTAEALAGPRSKPTGPKSTATRPATLPSKPPIETAVAAIPHSETRSKTLANGLEVVVVPNHEIPFVTMTLGLRSGASSEDPAKPGSASLACAMLTHGTTRHTADQLAAEMETYAIDIG